MRINNNFNVLPFYDSLQKQNSKKWYSFGQHYPLICPNNKLLPFQFVTNEELTIDGNIVAVNVTTGQATDLGVKPGVMLGTQPGAQYYIVKLAETAIDKSLEGLHYLQINTNKGYIYSEEFVFTDSYSDCVRLEYWNEDTLNFTSGEINFDDDFKFVMYISSTIGKPEYEFEEELTKRLGYKFIESQTSNKIYKFNFLAPEYICDAMRLVRMCDYINLTTKYDTYNALSFSYEPKWQNNGDLAAVDVEFDTDCIIQKLESFNRRLKESFYNALLADIDEPVLFSTDTVAQYYTEFTTTSYINGKLIRHLEAISEDELSKSINDIVLPIDNQSDTNQVAKKVFLSNIINKFAPQADLSNYLLKSVWDSVFELRNDIESGKPYIYGKLPVVLQYGLTMYSGDGVDIPSIYEGLPIDNDTIYWEDGILKAKSGTEGSITEITSSMVISALGYTPASATALSGYLPLTGGTLSDNTETPLILKGTYSDNVLFHLHNKSNIATSIGKYGTYTFLANYANGNGTGELEIHDDGRLTYATGGNNYSIWHEGNLNPSNYLPLIGGTLENTNGSPLRINSTNKGGSAIVILHNGADKSWFGYDKNVGRTYMYNTASQSYLGVRDNGTPYFNSYTIWHSGNDGSGSGLDADLLDGKHNGELTALYVKSQNVTTDDFSTYLNTYGNQGLSVLNNVSGSDVGDISSISAALNIGSMSNRLGRFIFARHDQSDGLYWQSSNSAYNAWGTKRKVAFVDSNVATATRIQAYTYNGSEKIIVSGTRTDNTYYRSIYDNGFTYRLKNDARGVDADIATVADNVASATKLQTARTIWGQGFNGTNNVSGDIYFKNNNIIRFEDTNGDSVSVVHFRGDNQLWIGRGIANLGYSSYLYGNSISFGYGTAGSIGMILNSSGNITIGSSDLAGTSAKLYVDGRIIIPNNSSISVKDTNNGVVSAVYMAPSNNLHFGYGTNEKSYSTYINGNNIHFRYGTNGTTGMLINTSGNVSIGASDLASTTYKLYIDGLTKITSSTNIGLQIDSSYKGEVTRGVQVLNPSMPFGDTNGVVLLFGQSTSAYNCGNIAYRHHGENNTNNYVSLGLYGKDNILVCKASGNVGIGSLNPTAKLQVNGDILTTGGITMYSARKLKTIQDERGLSLEELRIIKPTRFTWKDGRDRKIHIGGIADDVIKVLPEVIYKTGEDDTLTMDYGNAAFAIAASLIKPVVKHEERIKMLEEENKILKKEIEQLKWHIA